MDTTTFTTPTDADSAEDHLRFLRYAVSLVFFERTTGLFTWLPRQGGSKDSNRWNARYAGKSAGGLFGDGDIRISFRWNGRKRQVFAHHLAWFLETGKAVSGVIDHIDQIKTNNRPENLRDVNRAINGRNQAMHPKNKSGFCGVHWCKRDKRWIGRVGNITAGSSTDKEAAIRSVLAVREQHGYTELHGIGPAHAASLLHSHKPKEQDK